MRAPNRGRAWIAPATVLVNPMAGFAQVVARPEPWKLLALLVAVWSVLGLATVPRQLEMLQAALLGIGDPVLDAQTKALRAGLVRLIVADRLVPLPAALVAAVLLLLAAEPVLMLPAARRRELLAVVVLGLAPILAERVGELAVTWAASSGIGAAAGDALKAPHRFASGARLFWRSPEPAPLWVELTEARVNLFTLWCVGIWSAGLWSLESRRWAPWQVLVPLACLVGGGLLTWVLGPLVVPMVLRGLGG